MLSYETRDKIREDPISDSSHGIVEPHPLSLSAFMEINTLSGTRMYYVMVFPSPFRGLVRIESF